MTREKHPIPLDGLHSLPSPAISIAKTILVALGLFLCVSAQSRAQQIPSPQVTPPTDQALVPSLGELWTKFIVDALKDREYNIETEFTALYYDAAWGVLWIEENGNLIFCQINGANPPQFASGDRVRISGTVVPSQGISADRLDVRILQSGAYSPPKDIDENPAAVDGSTIEYIRVQGYAEQVEVIDNSHIRVNLIHKGKRFETFIKHQQTVAHNQLQNRFLQIDGLYVVNPGENGKSSIALWCEEDGQRIVVSSGTLEDRFNTPILKIADLDKGSYPNGIHLRGAVQSQDPGISLTIQDETGLIEIRSEQPAILEKNEIVDVIGLPNRHRLDWLLEDATYRTSRLAPEENQALASQIAEANRDRYWLIDQALSIPRSRLDQPNQTNISGSITFVDPQYRFLYMQDNTGGIRVDLNSLDLKNLSPGQTIRVLGTTTLGDYAPKIIARQIRTDREAPLPQAQPFSVENLSPARLDGLWIEAQGFVDNLRQEGDRTHFTLTNSKQALDVQIATHRDPLTIEPGAAVSVRAVLSTKAVSDGKIESVTLLVPSPQQVFLLQQDSSDPFAIPETPLEEIGYYRPPSQSNDPVKVTGTVTYHEPGKTIFIAKDDLVLRAASRSHDRLEPGETIELVGLIRREGQRLLLENTSFQRTGNGQSNIPSLLPSEATKSADLSYDGHLVSAQGKLLDHSATDEELRLVIQFDEAVIEAIAQTADIPELKPEFQIGATIAVTGIYDVSYNAYAEPETVRLLLRNPSDIVLVKSAPWMTGERFLLAVAVALTLLVAAGVWSVALRRQVRSQTSLIRSQIEREALLEEQQREILKSSSDFIFTIDFEGRFTSFNHAGEEITGYSEKEADKLTIFDLLDDRRSRILRALLDRRKAVPNKVFEAQIVTKSGKLHWVEVSAGILKRSGKTMSAFGVMHDIQKRKQVEEELKRARDAAEENTKAKSNFLATMSHELRTPMNGIIGMTDLLLDQDLKPQARDFGETIRDSASSLLVLLNDILDLSKAEAGKLTIDPHPFDLREAVTQTITLLETTANSKNLELHCHLPKRFPETLLGDAGRLRQVILNLVGNAIKFTHRGSVTLTLKVLSQTDKELVAGIQIVDTGIGITEKAKENLFQPFVQADASHSRRYGGTGLGLKISQEIVHLMQGEIGLDSVEGQGSTFWFTARFGIPEREETVAPVAAPKKKKKPTKDELTWQGPKLNILIAEDTPVNQRVTRLQLKKMGFESDLAKNGIEVLDAVSQKDYHLIFMDCQMPELDGFGATERLRQDPRYKDIHIVALTANAMAGDRERCLEVGMDDYVSKPTRPDKLMAAIRAYAEKVGLPT